MKNQISVLDFEGVPAIERPFFLTKSGGEKASPFTKFSVYYHLFWREAETHERPSHRFGQSEGRCGKTTSCVNLGVGLAQAGKKVQVIDCDSLIQPFHQPGPFQAGHPARHPFGNNGQGTERSAHRPRRGHPVSCGRCGSHALGIQLSRIEVSLVNAMSREAFLR